MIVLQPEFNPALPKRRKPSLWNRMSVGFLVWAVTVLVLFLLALINRAMH